MQTESTREDMQHDTISDLVFVGVSGSVKGGQSGPRNSSGLLAFQFQARILLWLSSEFRITIFFTIRKFTL